MAGLKKLGNFTYLVTQKDNLDIYGPILSWGQNFLFSISLIIARGVSRNQDGFVFALLHCYFSLKSLIYGLKWKLWSSFVCRITNCYPMLCNFVVGQFWSKVGLSLKYFSFCCVNFWKIVIFDKHEQYAHQMKAENM